MKDAEKENSKQRVFSLLKTIGSTAVKAGNEALRKKLNMSSDESFSVSHAAIRLTKGLDELKGAAMKVGQILSMMDEQLLPKGWKEALSKLQAEATPRPWQEIEPIIRAELGSLDDFSVIERESVHAASIAQVHCAYLKNGQKVAIKVQYPGLEKNIKSDLISMKRLIKLANIMPNMDNYDNLFIAAEEMFKQELDFEREKIFYDLYHKKFKNNPDIIIPKTITHLCTKRILVTEWIDGLNLQKWIDLHEDKTEERNKIGVLMFEVIFTEILLLNHIQSDPNPGNFLVSKDNKLVLLDFGATQVLGRDLVNSYVNLLQAGLKESRNEVLRHAKKLGFIETGDSDNIRDSFVKIFHLALEPFLVETYCWLNCSLTKRMNAETFLYMKLTKYRAPSGEILFMNRRLAGNLMLIEKLGSVFSAREIFLRILHIKKSQQQKDEDICSF
ncbi:MAG: AarF/ABC1/UbiB kinase family protein [Bdellovibrionota bacterium]